MKETVECVRCQGRMEIGYVADSTYGGYRQQNWSPGEAKRSFWTGLKINSDQFVPVTTLRCPKCGYLESYAIPQTSSDR
jgi:hypothetical protein